MFSTITAKYPGTCKHCGHDIKRGDRIRYAGPGRTYHLTTDCQAAPSSSTTAAESPDQRDHQWIPVTPMRGDRSRTCPTCKRPDVLTYEEARRGYQCRDCTRADEGPTYSDFTAPSFDQ